MSTQHRKKATRANALLTAIMSCLVLTPTAFIFLVAPTEASMGDIQRILYLHVSVAWCGLTGCTAMALFGALFLLQREEKWDFWSQASGEVGWLCTLLMLVTGSIWAHEAWGTWWTWEPRLTSALLLWVLYGGIFLVRLSIEDLHRRARISAVLALMSAADVPLIFMATRWFRGIHPVSPEMDPTMRLVLLVSAVCISALFACVVVMRRRQLGLADQVAEIEARDWAWNTVVT